MEGKDSWRDCLPAGALCVQHLWPVPSPQSTFSLLFLSSNACMLTFQGVGKIGQICWLLGKEASFERLRPSSCWCCHDVIYAALGAAWCFKGKGSASTKFFSHMYLQHQREMMLPCSKTDGRAGSRLSSVPPFVSILKVCTWKFYSSLEQQHHDRAHESQSLLCLVQEQHGREEVGMLAELCVGFVLLDH